MLCKAKRKPFKFLLFWTFVVLLIMAYNKDSITKLLPKNWQLNVPGPAKIKINTPSKDKISKDAIRTKLPKNGPPNVPRVEKMEMKTSSNDAVCEEFFNSKPLTPDIEKYFWKMAPIQCSKADIPNLIYVDEGGKYLILDKAKAKRLHINVDSCHYATLTRKGNISDFEVDISPWTKRFTDNISLPENVEHIWNKCHYRETLVASGYTSIIRKKPSVEKVCKENYKEHVEKHKPKETLSILLVGIDGTSRHNFARQMPLTKKFILSQMGAKEMFRVNKIGRNTFPNTAPLLTGRGETEVTKGRNEKREFMDKIDHFFLWEDARKNGYRTSVLLDTTRVSAFHYLKKGWKHPPWDYNNRPVVVATERRLHVAQYCIGETPEMTLFLDYFLQLTKTFNNSKTTPYFGFGFFAHVTHDYINTASSIDIHYLDFFKKLSAQKSLNNTLVVFFSDHGCRRGSFRLTFRGMLEDSNPFMFFIFPPWFESKYPKVMSNFRRNQHRVITNYDVHSTLKDVLNFKGDALLETKRNKTGYGISLFREIPLGRTCNESNIKSTYCICRNFTQKKVTGKWPVRMANQLLKHIIAKTDTLRNKCARLTLKSTVKVLRIFSTFFTDYSYVVTIMTSPGEAVYEATLTLMKSKPQTISVLDDVQRLNMYRGQADCVTDAKVQPFCYCKNLLT